MLQGGVGCEDRVVRLDDGVGHRGGGVHAELQFRLLAVVGREAFENEGTEAGTSSTAERVEHEEALETIAVVRQTTNLVHDDINLLLANGVVATSVWEHCQTMEPEVEKICNSQLLAASSLPVTRVSGWKRLL